MLQIQLGLAILTQSGTIEYLVKNMVLSEAINLAPLRSAGRAGARRSAPPCVGALAALVLVACTGRNSEISTQLTQQFVKGVEPINLSQLGPPSWQKMCVLPPYTANSHAEQILGFKWDAEGKTSIASSDRINVLVFVRGEEVIAYAEHPRNRGDLSQLKPSCLARASAKVVRRAGSDGWVYLVAQNAA
jgi:hypothetical protein